MCAALLSRVRAKIGLGAGEAKCLSENRLRRGGSPRRFSDRLLRQAGTTPLHAFSAKRPLLAAPADPYGSCGPRGAPGRAPALDLLLFVTSVLALRSEPIDANPSAGLLSQA